MYNKVEVFAGDTSGKKNVVAFTRIAKGVIMNIYEENVMNEIIRSTSVNQRVLAEKTGLSLGIVNRSIQGLKKEGYLTEQGSLTDRTEQELRANRPKRAIILAAGYGMRMAPINTTAPKALLEVNGERLIERLILQLKEVGIRDITVVVGFMKDEFEYLIDDYGVKLVVNAEYAVKNNLHSMALVASWPGNTYIVPCDLWCEENPFRRNEFLSWYMMADSPDPESGVRVNRKQEILWARSEGHRVIGISYLLERDWKHVRNRLKSLDSDKRHSESFWEEALFPENGDRMQIYARWFDPKKIVEINTYEQLRALDSGAKQLRSDAIMTISRVLKVKPEEITDINVLKKGMTNRSFLFSAGGERYIMRIPGEGTDQLIDREEEAEVFRTISGQDICDDPVYINPKNGYKITRFLEGVRNCDPEDPEDVRKCMRKLRKCHEKKLQVGHTFDLFGQIEFYESLWNGQPSVFRDYRKTKEEVLSLKDYIDSQPHDWALTHIDAVPDNFLFYRRDGKEELQLIDWEYAGMQDPHVDIAMFAVYSLYSREQVDRLIDAYFEGSCPEATRRKIYCYIAVCGLLWSNWCEYKRTFGVEFGEYSLRQYRFAKEYYRIFRGKENGQEQ